MLGSIKNKINLYLARKKWRKLNLFNDTYMSERFDFSVVSVGRESYGLLHVISHNSTSKLKIGNYCSIAPNVYFVLSGEHSLDRISTFPYKTHSLHTQKYEAGSNGDIVIDDDVWIGVNSTIMSGVHIGQGAVIAAGAVVTKNVDPYSIVGGVPAKLIRKRFNTDLIDVLMKIDFSKMDKTIISEHINELYIPFTKEEQIEWLPKKGMKK